jgi:hypothetical protein
MSIFVKIAIGYPDADRPSLTYNNDRKRSRSETVLASMVLQARLGTNQSPAWPSATGGWDWAQMA